jgi:ABC-type transporter Mla maintaining outer membrane lipid asymmetry permease subunit MlaE
MQEISRQDAQIGARLQIISSLGASLGLLIYAINALPALKKAEVWNHIKWMGLGALPLVSFASIFVGLSICTELVLQLKELGVEEQAGTIITVGLLRELAFLTVTTALCARCAAFVTEKLRSETDIMLASTEAIGKMVSPYLVAALISGGILSAYGLVIAICTCAVYTPFIGNTATADFLQSSRSAIVDKDVQVFFIKVTLVGPCIAVLSGFVTARDSKLSTACAVANSVSATCVGLAIANLAVTVAAFLP